MRRACVAWLALLAAGAAWAAGCGWNRGLTVGEGVHSVGVEIFRTERDVLERGLEADLHAALSRAVSDLVGARLVAPEDADWVVRGTIAGYRRRGGIRNRQNQQIAFEQLTIDGHPQGLVGGALNLLLMQLE